MKVKPDQTRLPEISRQLGRQVLTVGQKERFHAIPGYEGNDIEEVRIEERFAPRDPHTVTVCLLPAGQNIVAHVL
jgi:hypothetical protein